MHYTNTRHIWIVLDKRRVCIINSPRVNIDTYYNCLYNCKLKVNGTIACILVKESLLNVPHQMYAIHCMILLFIEHLICIYYTYMYMYI